jgi:recombination associated protein RdgC
MFFKNMLVYHLAEPFSFSSEQFNDQLSKNAFFSCPRSESFSMGWVSPYGLGSSQFVHSLQGYLLFCFCKEEKILPNTVIREELEKRINEIEQREDRKVYRKEKLQLKEEVIIHLRHQAFSRKKAIFAYIDTQKNYLLIDTSSRNRAEELCAYLRKTIGSLKLALPATRSEPGMIMTSWLIHKQQPMNFKIENNCDMIDSKLRIGMIKCKEQDLVSDEIISHFHSGKQLTKLALNWEDKISFEFCEDLSIKKIRFLDLIRDQKQGQLQSKQEQIDMDFAIMTGEFSQFLNDLWLSFDGLEA